ncbi:MAG: hypothetical protein QXT45_06830 [Candidatus Bilamarchaeaceae archaeon]
MQILRDGSIVQSGLSLMDMGKVNQVYMHDVSIKKGIVTAIYYPDEKDNVSKKWIEYDVTALEENAEGSVSTVTYLRCQVVDVFGAPDAYLRYTLRPPVEQKDGTYVKGAHVLVLAASGNTGYGRAFIIGGFYNTDTFATPPKKEDGQFYEFFFNGVQVKIDKDGQYSLTYNSVVDADGKKASEESAGTRFFIDKEGALVLEDKNKQTIKIDRKGEKIIIGTEDGQIVIDKKQKAIQLQSKGKVEQEAKEDFAVKGKNVNVNAEGRAGIKAQQDISIEAQANVQMKAGSNWQVQISGNATIKAGGNLIMEGGGNAQLKGGALTQLGAGSVPAAGVGISQAFGTNGGGPMISNIITGSATTLIGS